MPGIGVFVFKVKVGGWKWWKLGAGLVSFCVNPLFVQVLWSPFVYFLYMLGQAARFSLVYASFV